ncbi:POU domain, class 6, transcription factor 1 isoform X1 [Stegostoma tigrinum]|uniref:POU domain, class 6, transcription factor 1 isoform X1 n=1 Tax=Stegostoma tigrinum TaxID=3053191 RepID=UPI00286FFE2B|nr:POU domain, class 6, transcription factor 1 isoform X1 [Stegostoma tigrinum]
METGSLTEQRDALSSTKQATVMTGQEIIKISLRKAEVSSKAAGDVEPQGIVLPAAVVVEENSERNISTEALRVHRTSMEKNHHCGSTEQAETTPPSGPTPVTEGQAEQLHLQQQQTMPVSAPTISQILPSENLAAVVMASTGSVPLNQPLLIPLNMAGQVTAQQGLVLTFPTASIGSLPSLTSVTGAGGIVKLPLTNLQAASLLNTALQPTQLQQALQPQATLQSLPTSTVPLKQLEPQTQVTSIHPAQGLTLNPTILSSQPSLVGSLTATPVIANAVPSFQGITSQIITNAQGQVIGTVPLVMNPTTITTTNPVTAVAAQSLQVQAVTPQMLLNSQGQVIATVISNQFVPVLSRQGVPLSPVKAAQQVQPLQTMAAVTQPSVTPTTATAPTEPITPSSTSSAASVGQLVSKPQNAPTEVDGINLEEIREFAKNFKIRRLSLGLTQTQVGQALSAAEGPAYSQSAICRFEKLDITPKSAQKIKPVLERWLTEAEIRHRAGIQNLTEFVGSEPSKKRKRRTSFTPQALEILNAHFEKNTHPTGQEMTEIAEQLNYDREVVRVWFCNKRQTLKNTIKRLQQNDTTGTGSVERLSDSTVNIAGTG